MKGIGGPVKALIGERMIWSRGLKLFGFGSGASGYRTWHKERSERFDKDRPLSPSRNRRTS